MAVPTVLLAQAPIDKIAAPPMDFIAVMPILIIFGAAVVSVVAEAGLARKYRHVTQLWITIIAIVAATVWTFVAGAKKIYALTFAGMLSVDGASYVMWGTLLLLALPSILLMADRVTEPGGTLVAQAAATPGSARARLATRVATPMQTEVFPLALFSLGGMLVFGVTTNLLTLFVALEALSMPLYLMCGLARRRRLISQEAALKYFLIGSFTSALMLYGIAMLYGYSGTVSYAGIAAAARAGANSDVLLMVGIGLLVVGLMYKGSVGPFHLWTPDVYQGAPTPVTAFMASCTKTAAFVAMLRVFQVALEPMAWSWRPVLAVIAVVSMVIGAVLGIVQNDMKRLLAYSSISHAGFILLGVMSLSSAGESGTLFYLITYGFATVGAFGLVMLVRRGNGEAWQISDWSGMGKKSPVVALMMTIFLLSFAGIPLTAGFMGKWVIFSAAIGAGLTPLVVIAMIATVVTAFYYLRVVVVMYFSEARADGPVVAIPHPLTSVMIGACAVLTLVLGIVPEWAIDLMHVPFPLLS